MNTEILSKIESSKMRKDLPAFGTGDTVSVKSIIREGDKQRFQKFKGIVIAIKGSGLGKTFTLRKISYGVGVEKIIPFNSPNIAEIEVIKKGDVRRSKLYYMRKRIGKAALKIKDQEIISSMESSEEESTSGE